MEGGYDMGRWLWTTPKYYLFGGDECYKVIRSDGVGLDMIAAT